MFRRSFDTNTDISDKNVSMCTRASSIRSTYTTTATKTKFLIPQRIVGRNGNSHGSNGFGSTIHHPTHYKALSTFDSSKNNNVAKNGGMGGKNNHNNHNNNNNNNTNNSVGQKSKWLFSKVTSTPNNRSKSTTTIPLTTMNAKSMAAATDGDTDWRSTKNLSNCPQVLRNNDSRSGSILSTTRGTSPLSSANKNVYFQPIATDTATDDISKACRCQEYQNNFLSASQIRLNGSVGSDMNALIPSRPSNTDLQLQQQQTGSHNGDDDDLSDVDFRKSIIKINNIYNNYRATNLCNNEKYALVDCYSNDRRLTLNDDEVVL